MSYYTNFYFGIINNSWFKGSNYLKLTSQPGTVSIIDTASFVSENNLSSQLSTYDFSNTLVLENIIPEN